MNPIKFGQLMKHLVRAKQKKPDLPEVFRASDAPIPEETLTRDMFKEAQERFKNAKAGGGMLVQPGFGGVRQGYRQDKLSKLEQKKIKEAFPNTKFDFDKHTYGVKKYPDIKNQNITNKDYTKVLRFIKKGFKLGKGEGLTTRGTVPKARGTKLSLKDQELIKAQFELPPGEEWDFKTHKYGIKQLGRENLLARMARRLKDKKPWKVAADRGSTKGWMLLQMNRVFENEKKRGVKNLTYQPVYKEINGIKRIIGFKDNTVAGGGNYYYGLDKYSKKNATDITQHGDFKLNQKLVDISKRSFNQPNEVITGLLKQKGFTDKVRLNDLIQYLSGTPGNSKDALLNAVTRHHQSGVKFGSATDDLALTTRTINNTIKGIEGRIANNIIKPEDIEVLKNNNVFVRSPGGKLYGAGAKTPIGQFKQIEKGVETAIRSPDFNVKGLSSFMKDLGIKCRLANGINCNMPQAYEKSLNELSTKAQAGDSAAAAKMTNFTKSVRGAGNIIKGTLGPAALLFEAGIAVPIGLFEYAQGKPATEIVDSLTYGLFGKNREDRLKELDPTYGAAENLQNISERLTNLERLQKGTMGQRIRSKPQFEKTMDQFETASKPFLDTGDPQKALLENIKKSQDLKQKLIDEDLQRKEDRTTQFDLSDPFMAAGGGIAKEAGDPSGAMLESMNPDSQGLPGLLKRGRRR